MQVRRTGSDGATSSGSTRSATAGTVSQRVALGAPAESRLRATSTALSIAAITISTSNPYLRAKNMGRLTRSNVLQVLERRLLPE